ncbi:hypothetical protein VTJ49DRAFT_4359 [Mycothermus thermophilus]|uniref:Uncharacterized protein n=1 Tax=Humicola insolens TaxID=85995 RepID=A0ABR3VLT7_HUMIN
MLAVGITVLIPPGNIPSIRSTQTCCSSASSSHSNNIQSIRWTDLLLIDCKIGAAISSFIDTVDQQDEKKKTANDALNSLMDLCDVKSKAFFDEIVSKTASEGARLLPIDKVTAKDYQTYCNFSKGAESTAQEINNAIGSFVKGEILKGLTTTITSEIQRLIGSVSANKSERRGYVIAVGHLGGVYRVDYFLYYYKFTSQAITSVCQEVLLQCWAISSVDVKQLNANTLDVILQQGYTQEEGETEEAFYNRLKKLKKSVLDELSENRLRAAVIERRIRGAMQGKSGSA